MALLKDSDYVCRSFGPVEFGKHRAQGEQFVQWQRQWVDGRNNTNTLLLSPHVKSTPVREFSYIPPPHPPPPYPPPTKKTQKNCSLPGTIVTSPATYLESTSFGRNDSVPTYRDFLQSSVANTGAFPQERIMTDSSDILHIMNIKFLIQICEP